MWQGCALVIHESQKRQYTFLRHLQITDTRFSKESIITMNTLVTSISFENKSLNANIGHVL